MKSVLLACTLVAAIFLGAYFFLSSSKLAFNVAQPQPTGRITFSVANLPIDTASKGGIMTLTANLDKGKYSVPTPDNAGTLEYQYRMIATTSRPWIVFVRATDLSGSVKDVTTVPFEVYRANLYKVPWSQLDAKINAAEKITNDPTKVKLSPEISSRGDVVYMARSVAATALKNVEDWSIYEVPNNGKAKLLTHGMYPKWVDEDQFVYLKNDGLYLYTLSKAISVRILGAEGKITNSDTLYVSDDGEYIAWSVPEKKSLHIIQAQNWKEGRFLYKGAVPIVGWYPVISPDDTFVAILTEVKLGANNWFPIISFVNLQTLKLVKSAAFSLNKVYDNTQATTDPAKPLSQGSNFNYITLGSWLQPTNTR